MKTSGSGQAGWPGRVAVGILRSDPPQVFIAESEEVLGRLIAMEVVATSDPRQMSRGLLDEIRQALLEERWGDAVAAWIEATGEAVDAYPDEVVWTEARLDAERASFEIRLSKVFETE